jgi:DNA-binding response OmpR family regulator
MTAGAWPRRRPGTILLVDDDIDFAEMVMGYFSERGFRVVVASEFASAITAILREQPRFI